MLVVAIYKIAAGDHETPPTKKFTSQKGKSYVDLLECLNIRIFRSPTKEDI